MNGRHVIIGPDLGGTLEQPGGRRKLALRIEKPGIVEVGLVQAGVERKGTLELGSSLRVASILMQGQSLGGMSLAEVRVECQGLGTHLKNTIRRDLGGMPRVQGRVAVCDAGIGTGIVGIEFDRLAKHPPRQEQVRF
jgi:hypothetical protein